MKSNYSYISFLYYISFSYYISDSLSEEAKSVLSNKKKKNSDNTNDSNAINLVLNFKRYVFDKSMSQ